MVEGTAIYNQLMRHPAKKIVTVDCWACSIASVIAMAGDEVIMPRNSLMFVHEMSWGAWGTSSVLRKAADDLETFNAVGRSAYLRKAGGKLTEERLMELEAAETWLTAQECVDLGLADRIADYDSDMGNALSILQRDSQILEQRLQAHKELSAQLRQLTVQAEPATTETDPAQEPVPTEAPNPPDEPPQPQQRTLLDLFSNF